MKCSLLFWCILLLLQRPLTTTASDVETENSTASNSTTSQIEEVVEVSAIELNPDFEDEYDSDGDLSDDEDSDSELEPKESAKATISKVLANKKKQLAKKRTMITLALAIFAFRREIVFTILQFLKKLFINPKTGKLTLSPTQILKLLLFIDIARKLQQGGMNNSTLHPKLEKLNPMVGGLMKGFLTSNPAYVPPLFQHYTFERVNERYLKDGLALHKAIHKTHDQFKWSPSYSELNKNMEGPVINMNVKKSNETAIILDLTQLGPSPSEVIRDQVSFVLSQYRQAAMTTKDSTTDLEIIVVLESPGGSAVDFGLAAQQLLRLRNEPGILLTICVDRVAASGGYMLACTASPGRLFAAPFSVIGSIGVIGQIINIHELLERKGVTPVVLRGGKNKAPLGLIGKITKNSMDTTQSMIDDTHKAFKQHVATSRPILKRRIDKVGTGDVWLGSDAIRMDLIDRITTSDEYISDKVASGARVLKMIKCPPRSLVFARHATSMRVGPIHQLVRTFLTILKTSIAEIQGPRISLRDEMETPMEEKLPIAASTVGTPKMTL